MHGADQVGDEHEAALQHRDDEQVLAGFGGDLGGHFGITRGDCRLVVENADTLGLGHRRPFLSARAHARAAP